MKLSSAVLALFLVMDPLGNIPPFLSVLKNVQPDRRRQVLVREVLIAYVVLLVSVYREGDAYSFPESQLIDWIISKPDGTEEGNFVGNFLDSYQVTNIEGGAQF